MRLVFLPVLLVYFFVLGFVIFFFFKQKTADEMRISDWSSDVCSSDLGLTYSPALPNGSELVSGQWWAAGYKGPPLVSVEQEVATSLGLKLGDTLSVNVLGVEVQATVASFRTVTWDNFGLNYVLVFSPGTFEAAPHNIDRKSTRLNSSH